MNDFVLQAILLLATNAITAYITNSQVRKKNSAEASEHISNAYTTLVEDLQSQITIMKERMEELEDRVLDLTIQNRELTIKVNHLEQENHQLKNIN
jgi:TolA-binding protein